MTRESLPDQWNELPAGWQPPPTLPKSFPSNFSGRWKGWGRGQGPYWQVWETKTITTNGTGGIPQFDAPVVDDEHIRKIVRQEMADLAPADVPDSVPEDWQGEE